MESLTEQNREIVRRAFADWARVGTRFFDLLAPAADWTIMGSGRAARTYHGRQAYVDAVMTPLAARLAGLVIPQLHQLWADGDQVIIRWAQDTPTRDGRRYRNEYAWFFTMRDGQAVAVTAFLDLAAYDELLTRVAGPG